MYRINQLPRKVLITPDEVIQWGPTDNTVDSRNILMAIQIAEDRFIKPALCKDLYNDIRDAKNVVVTDVNKTYLESLFTGVTLNNGQMVNAIEFVSDVYQGLWNEYLWKLLGECVIYVATPTNWSKYTSQGEMQNNPKGVMLQGDGSMSVALKDLQWKMDKMLMDRIDPQMAAMQEYICDNIADFSLYNCHKCLKNENGISYKRKSPWIHNAYTKRDCEQRYIDPYGKYSDDDCGDCTNPAITPT